MHPVVPHIRVLLLASLAFLPLKSASAQTVTTPIDIPLVTETYTNSDGSTYEKLGIWASLGGGATPQLFEFDTGGEGFYAAYSNTSSWWGTNYTSSGIQVSNSYSSGNDYTGTQVTTGVTLYTGSSPASAAITTPSNIAVGQVTNILNGSTTLWPATNPPVDTYFYGDFGLSLANKSSLLNLLAQLNYTNGITPGYIIHAEAYGDTNGAYLQIGLTSSNITTFGTAGAVFQMAGQDTNILFTNSNLPTYSNGQAITGSMQIGSNTFTNVGMNLDTGNPTPGIHNPSSNGVPSDLMTNPVSGGTYLVSGLSLSLSATNTNGTVSSVFSLTTGTNYGSNAVYVSSDNNAFYINAGINAFYGNEVMYNLSDGTIGIVQAVPEPESLSLLVLAAALFLLTFRKLKHKIP